MHLKDLLILTVEQWGDENWDILSQQEEPYDEPERDWEYHYPPVSKEDVRIYMEGITLENDLEELDLYSRPEGETVLHPHEVQLARVELFDELLARRRAEREPENGLRRKAMRMSDKCLEAEIQRLEAGRKVRSRSSEDMRLEAARISPSAERLWHGKTLSSGTS